MKVTDQQILRAILTCREQADNLWGPANLDTLAETIGQDGVETLTKGGLSLRVNDLRMRGLVDALTVNGNTLTWSLTVTEQGLALLEEENNGQNVEEPGVQGG